MTRTNNSHDSIRDALKRDGFAAFGAADFANDPALAGSWEELRSAFDALPPDPNSSARHRRHSRFAYLPWNAHLSPRPGSGYSQPAALNPEAGGAARQFAPLTAKLLKNKFLRWLISFDFAASPFATEQLQVPHDVGVHLVRMLARPGMPGISSPNCLHKDGEPYTFVHLVGRRDITGGESLVADNTKQIKFESLLLRPLDSLAVSDAAVYHQVKEVRVLPGRDWGARDVILIDFTPMKPDLILPTQAA